MNVDIFGYTRDRAGSTIMSSDYAALHLNSSGGLGTKLGLLQNAMANYAHRVEPRYEAGSSEIYWAAGQSMGKVSAGRLVGDVGILQGVQFDRNPNNNRKGSMAGIDFKLGVPALARSTVHMAGCVAQGISINFGAGALDVQESLDIMVARMERVGA